MKLHNMPTMEYDVLVIGAGPGGLSAAKAAMEAARGSSSAADRNPDFRVAVLDRDEIPGGILNQCVHDGFGIVRYGEQLSGPEYAEIEADKARQAGAEMLTGCMVTEIRRQEGTARRPEETQEQVLPGNASPASATGAFEVTAMSRSGCHVFKAKSVVLATGCRERTRGMLSIPGTRPAGIFTAGAAQNLINRKNIMIGKRVVLLGTGDIGLIMARRLTLEGAEVICAAEVMEQPSGLARNVRQCLFDYDIPLHLRTTVSNIYGKGRLEAVELAQVDDRLRPIPGTERRVECDTLILSVGLIPENEVAKTAGAALDSKTGGAITDAYLQTNVPGLFACGNARAVMDLADFVSQQGEIAGANAAMYAAGLAEQAADGADPQKSAGPDSAGGADLPLRRWETELHNAARKGMPEENSVTCTLCPKGCQIRAVRSGEEVRGNGVRRSGEPDGLTFTGNGCPRGEAFARQEMTDPQRILTTTMRVEVGPEGKPNRGAVANRCSAADRGAATDRAAANRGPLIPVRSDRPVPLDEMRRLAAELSRVVIPREKAEQIRCGDVVAEGLGRNRVNIIAEKSARE